MFYVWCVSSNRETQQSHYRLDQHHSFTRLLDRLLRSLRHDRSHILLIFRELLGSLSDRTQNSNQRVGESRLEHRHRLILSSHLPTIPTLYSSYTFSMDVSVAAVINVSRLYTSGRFSFSNLPIASTEYPYERPGMLSVFARLMHSRMRSGLSFVERTKILYR